MCAVCLAFSFSGGRRRLFARFYFFFPGDRYCVFAGYLSYLPRFTEMMNTEVKGNLSIGENIEWSFLNNQVYETLHGDLMKPVTKKSKSTEAYLRFDARSLLFSFQLRFCWTTQTLKSLFITGCWTFWSTRQVCGTTYLRFLTRLFYSPFKVRGCGWTTWSGSSRTSGGKWGKVLSKWSKTLLKVIIKNTGI